MVHSGIRESRHVGVIHRNLKKLVKVQLIFPIVIWHCFCFYEISNELKTSINGSCCLLLNHYGGGEIHQRTGGRNN